MIDHNIIDRNNYHYHLSTLEYGSPCWNKAMDSLLIEAGRLEGRMEENERRLWEALQKNGNAGTDSLQNSGQAILSTIAKSDLMDASAASD